MVKARSPQYPAISLKEAVEKVASIYARDYQNAIPRQVVAEHMGYASLNGKSLGVLAALGKYGLLEGRGDETRVSDLAVQIIAHPPGTQERGVALREAASLPDLFSHLDDRFRDGKASDQAIRSYLLTQKFIPAAADAAIRAYRETKQFVDMETAGHLPDHTNENPLIRDFEHFPNSSTVAAPLAAGAGASSRPMPFRVEITRDALEVSGRLTTLDDVEMLIKVLTLNKVMLAQTTMATDTKPAENNDDKGGDIYG